MVSALCADGARGSLLANAGFQDIRVDREKREDVVESFDDYGAPIEAGTGSTAGLPHALRRETPLSTSGGERPTFAVRVSRAAIHECRDADRQRASLKNRNFKNVELREFCS
jgi:hypothetical protein